MSLRIVFEMLFTFLLFLPFSGCLPDQSSDLDNPSPQKLTENAVGSPIQLLIPATILISQIQSNCSVKIDGAGTVIESSAENVPAIKLTGSADAPSLSVLSNLLAAFDCTSSFIVHPVQLETGGLSTVTITAGAS